MSVCGESTMEVSPVSESRDETLGCMNCETALVLGMENMEAGVSGCESLNGAAEPGCDLLETDVFEVTKSMRAKDRRHGRRLETAGRSFTHFLKLFGPRLFDLPQLFGECFGRLHVIEHHLRVLDGRNVVQSAADCILGEIRHNPEPGEKRGRVLAQACGGEFRSQIVPLEVDWHENKPGRTSDLSFGQALKFSSLRCGVVNLIDTDFERDMGIAERESVESGAKDNDLPNPAFDGSR